VGISILRSKGIVIRYCPRVSTLICRDLKMRHQSRPMKCPTSVRRLPMHTFALLFCATFAAPFPDWVNIRYTPSRSWSRRGGRLALWPDPTGSVRRRFSAYPARVSRVSRAGLARIRRGSGASTLPASALGPASSVAAQNSFYIHSPRDTPCASSSPQLSRHATIRRRDGDGCAISSL